MLFIGPAILNGHIPSFDESGLAQALAERSDKVCGAGGRRAPEKTNHRHCRLLPPSAPYLDREQQAAATNQCDELTPLHVRHGDFLPYALSAPPTGPCARFFGTSACH